MTPSLSPPVRFGVAAFALVGAIAGLFPAVLLNLTELRGGLGAIYLGCTFLSSLGVVALAFRAGLVPEVRGGIPFTLTMVFVGALNGGFSAMLQAVLSGEQNLVLLVGMCGAVVGLALGLVYALMLWPGLRALREVMVQSTLNDGVWVRHYVSLTWMGCGLLLHAGALAMRHAPWLEHIVPHALAAGVLYPGVVVFAFTAWQRRVLSRIASGVHPGYERMAAATLGAEAEGLPRLHPWVSQHADHVIVRVLSQDDGPYRAGTTGEPYARVDG